MPVKQPLSAKDSGVLQALFDLEASLSANHPTPKDVALKALPNMDDEVFRELQQNERIVISPLHTDKPSKAALSEAATALTVLIQAHPTYPSAYVNRAQVSRMLMSDSFASASVFDDLAQAIVLAAPQQRNETISDHRAKVLAAAYSHRGFVLLGAAIDASKPDMMSRDAIKAIPEALQNMDEESINELASRDFAEAARYGDELARLMAVRTNPYAKMCGAIVKGALREEIDEWRGKSSISVLPQEKRIP